MGTPRRRPSSDEVIWKMLVEGERPTKADVAKLGLDKEVFLAAMKLVRSHLNRMRGHRPLVELASPDYDRCSDARARLTQQPAAQRVWEVASWVQDSKPLHGTQHFAATIYLAMSGKWLIAESSGAAYEIPTDEGLLEHIFSQAWPSLCLYHVTRPHNYITSIPLELVASVHRVVSLSNSIRGEDQKKGIEVAGTLNSMLGRISLF